MSATLARLPDATEPLSAAAAHDAFEAIMAGRVDDDAIARLLTQLADRGETVEELVAAARALRSRATTIEAPPGAIDVCGTGGDGLHSLNVSTAVAIVVAACGVAVAKHGNRAASSRSGTADVLEALGIDVQVSPWTVERSIREVGIGFLFAAKHHAAMARVAGVRRALGRRTIFNLVGPLANPAGVRRQLLGVAGREWVRPMADALAELDAEAAMVVNGDDGLDELTVTGGSCAIRVDFEATHAEIVRPETAGLAVHPPAALVGGSAAENALALTALLAGARGAYRDIVLLNSAAALIVADRARGWKAGARAAAEAIDSGAARDLLARWIAFK